MRLALLPLLALSLAFAADDGAETADQPRPPVSAEESAKILAQMKAEKVAKAAAAKAERDAAIARGETPPAEKPKADPAELAAKREADEKDAKLAKARRDLESAKSKYKYAAHTAYGHAKQFCERAKAEGGSCSISAALSKECQTKTTGATNKTALAAVDDARSWAAKIRAAKEILGEKPSGTDLDDKVIRYCLQQGDGGGD